MFKVQDDAYSGSYSVHEAIVHASIGAISGGGAFAFVSATGVELCFGDPALSDLSTSGSFDLIVGVDQITNTKALAALQGIHDRNPEFVSKAYLSPKTGMIFHPKFVWFRKARGGNLVLGSGNLTLNGLRRNCEAFVLLELDEEEMSVFLDSWDLWREDVDARLLPIDSAEIIEQAERNRKRAIYIRSQGDDPEAAAVGKDEPQIEEGIAPEETGNSEPRVAAAAEDVELDDWAVNDAQEVLVAEIPKASNRWNQANFDKYSFEDFFGATAGDNAHRILLKHIADDGTSGSIESRQSVSVASQNYRFELNAAANLTYPTDGRPIGVFVKLTTRMFLYALAMPGSAYYDELNEWLENNYRGRADRMKRLRTNAGLLKQSVPDLPLW